MKCRDGGNGGGGGERRFEVFDIDGAEAAARGGDCILIAIDAEHARAGIAQDGGVAAAAERGIDSACASGRPVPHGRGEDRDVIRKRWRVGGCRGHAP